MQQTYFCPNCSAPVTYGERFCGNCGFTINWQAGQMPPTYNPYQQPQQWGQQQYWPGQAQQGQNQWGQQQWQPQGQNQWGQPQWNQPYYTQQPGYGQQPQWADQYGYSGQYAGYGPGTKKKSSSGTLWLIAFVVLLFIAGGVILATNGAIFDSLSGGSSQPTDTQTTSTPPETTSTPAVTYNEEPKIEEFYIDPASIKPGGTANLIWQVSNASSVMINNGIGKQPPTGQIQIKPPENLSYTITVTNNIGTVAATTAVAISTADAPVINSFTADPISINVGQSSNLQWNVSNAASIYIDNDIGDISSGMVTKSVSPSITTTYTLTATNSTGTSTASVTVTVSVSSDAPVITSFSANPETIAAGQPVTLEWYVTGATTVTMTPDIGTLAAYGSKSVSPSTTTTYTLTASNASGSVTASVSVVVEGSSAVNSPVINAFMASPTQMTTESLQVVTLTWDVTGADTVSIYSVGEVTSSGSYLVYPTTTTIYTITATNTSASVYASVTVTVQD